MRELCLLNSVASAVNRAQASRDIFLQITHSRAGRQVDSPGDAKALAGLPFAAKDVFDVRGTRTSAASQVFDRRPHALEDAEAVRRVTASGAVLIGKTTMSELAYSGIGMNERFGTPTITRDGRDYVVGGSSSGSAAAVHAGIVAFALASDTSGSSRIPAAWTGLYGFRPSRGRYSSVGMTPLAPTLDTVGVIAADLTHVDAVDAVLAGEMRLTSPSAPPTFVIPHDDYLARCDYAVLTRFHADLARLKAAGADIVQRRFESLDSASNLHRLHVPIVESEAFSTFGRFLDSPGLLSLPVRRRLERARTRLEEHSSDILYRAMPELRNQFAQELEEQVLLSPTVEIDPPALEDLRTSSELHDAVSRRSIALTMLLSYLDSPSLAAPTSAETTEPPSSLQLSARAGSDRAVLDAARWLASL